MSDMGPLTYGKKEEQIFLGREIAQHRDFSEATAVRIDEEVKKLVDASHDKVTALLSENIEILKSLAHLLLEKETLVLEDIENIMKEAGMVSQESSPEAPAAGKDQ